MSKHAFLSDKWFEAVEKLIEVHGADAPGSIDIVTNVVVTETPFGGERHLHMSSQDGKGHVGIGHTEGADVTVTTDYETAKEMFVLGDPSAAMQAFMAGKVRIQGDLAKMMASQAAGTPTTSNAALLEAIQGITQ